VEGKGIFGHQCRKIQEAAPSPRKPIDALPYGALPKYMAPQHYLQEMD